MAGEVVVEVKDLIRSFDGRKVLDGVNIEVCRGETLVVMGGSGCGKSTLLRHMVGAMTPDSGEIIMFGKKIAELPEDEKDKLKRKFGILFQSGALLDSLTVAENVSLALREHTKLDENIINTIIKMKLELVGLRGFENLMPAYLSGGMKKRVGLARAIAMDPEIVFYDEPTAGLDPIMGAVIDKLMLDLSSKLNFTNVVVTHDMNSVARIATKIAMLHKGKVIAYGTKEEMLNSDNPMVQQFVSGNPEGPVQFMQNGDDYLEDIVKTV